MFKLFLLDMDGTIYIDDQLFDGCLELLEHIKKIGGRYIFLTNNSSKSVDNYVEKLRRLNINVSSDDFLTSTQVTARYLMENYAGKRIYGFGTAAFKEELAKSGLDIVDTPEDGVACLAAGFDTELSFKKLEDACILLNRGVDYIATNPDWVCPTWYGYVPDCGSVSEMLYRATKRRPKFMGKPEPAMALLAMERTGFGPDETIMIGDRLYTDIACGVNAKIKTALVLSGESTAGDVENSEIKPTFIFKDIKEFYRKLV